MKLVPFREKARRRFYGGIFKGGALRPDEEVQRLDLPGDDRILYELLPVC